MQVIKGRGRESDRSVDLAEAIEAAIYEHADGLTLIAVIGALELVKLQLVMDQGGVEE